MTAVKAHTDTLNKPENHTYGAKNGDKVVTQRFRIKPRKDCKIQNVGFRPALVCKSSKYGVKVCPLNRDDGSVEVIVKGKEKEFMDEGCMNYDVLELKDNEDISNDEFYYCLSELNLEQSEKGVRVRERMKVMRSLSTEDGAEAFSDGFRTYYNYLRPNQALNGMTPWHTRKSVRQSLALDD